MKFYDLESRGGSWYLLENGQPIARFDEVGAAEAVRESFCQELIARFEMRLEEGLE